MPNLRRRRQEPRCPPFDRQATPYARPELDITDQIIVMYNAGEAAAAEPAVSTQAPTSA